jgi:hypothetical protein
VTDDLAAYKTVLDKLDVDHQICQFHVRRWVGRTMKELRETVPEAWRKIGRMKIRSRTVRGYKSPNGMLAGLLVAACRTA